MAPFIAYMACLFFFFKGRGKNISKISFHLSRSKISFDSLRSKISLTYSPIMEPKNSWSQKNYGLNAWLSLEMVDLTAR
jgi:hypothetical protein